MATSDPLQVPIEKQHRRLPAWRKCPRELPGITSTMKTDPRKQVSAAVALALLATAPSRAGFVTNPSFEANYNETFPHYSAADGWNGASGVNNSSGPFHNGGTPIPDGTQVGFKQGSGTVSQEITGLTVGKRYVIQFAYDARACCGGSIDLATQINGVELDKIPNVKPVTGGEPYRVRTVPFTADADTVTLGLTTVSSGDATINLDAVSIVQRDADQLPIFNASFEASGDVADTGLLTPNGLGGWVAEGNYGVNVSGAGPFADNGTAPDQDHVAFIQGIGALRQTVRFVAGKPYQLSVAYNARAGNSPRFQIKIDGAVVFTEDVAPVGGTAAYRTKTLSFTPTGVSADVEFAQIKDGDHTLLLDNIKISGEQPAQAEPISLTPEVAEVALGEQFSITVKAPSDALAAKDVDLVIQSSAPNAIRFVDPSGALTLRTTLHFAKGGSPEKTIKVQGLARGAGNIQVIDAGGLPIKNQIAATVVTSALKNPSFDHTPAPGGVGYGAVPGWTGGSGINSATQPFADNGTIPDRSQVAFIQGAAAMSQEVRGLVPGKNYWLQFFYNIRNCCPAETTKMDLAVNLGGAEVAKITGITPVVTGPYNFQNIPFVATSPTALLEFKTTPTGDATLLLDGVNVVQRDVGQVVVKNPSFEASGGLFPFPGYFPSIAGWDVAGGGRGVNIDGVGPFTDNGRANAGDLVLFLQGNGASISQNLTGLVDGKKYIVGLLMNGRNCCSPEDTGISVSFNDNPILEESFRPVGGANPFYVRQATFTAAGTEGVLKITGVNTGGDHTLLVDNVVVIPDTGSAPVVLSEPQAATVLAGGSVGLGVAAVGGGTLTYQWKRGGQAIAGATDATLTVDNITPALSGQYTVEVKNAAGAVVSAAAAVTVLEPIAGLFDTGVGADRTPLGDGDTDTHYTLTKNADNATSTTVFAQDSTKFPIVAGPWIANSDVSRWVGPRADPSAATAGGDYIYRIPLDLTGFLPSTVVLTGSWASDNSAEIQINGVGTGVTQSGFTAFNTFTVTGGFKEGINQIEFKVTNGDQAGGPTGLRVEGLTAVGAKGSVVTPTIKLIVARAGANVTVTSDPATLPAGVVLQTATSVAGPWATQAGLKTPFTAPIGADNQFLRAVKP